MSPHQRIFGYGGDAMTEDHTGVPGPAPDPGNAPPEAWTGDPIDPAQERAMIEAALQLDVRAEPYEVEGWEEVHGV
jgi:hypothetical protein